MRIIYPIVIIGLMMTATSFAGRDFSKTEIKTTHVAGTVYMLQGEGGNIGVSVGDDGVLMVDDQFAPLQEKIQAAIDQLSEKDVRYLLNTHWHGDHTGGNETITKAGTTIIAHENVRARLAAGQFVPFFNRTIDPRPKDALPVITFDRSVTIHFNDERIDVLHFATGHTDGDSIIFFREANVVHMGDQFFNGSYPYIDLGSRHYLYKIHRQKDNQPRLMQLFFLLNSARLPWTHKQNSF